jgi:hypothetical protein
VVHAGAGEKNGTIRRKVGDEELSKAEADDVPGPDVLGKEAVVVGPVADTDLTGGENALGDEAVSRRERPTGEDQHEQAKGGRAERRAEMV